MFKKSVFVFFCFLVVMLACTACSSVGDKLTSKDDISLIEDWNSPTMTKPIACYLHKGEKVEVVDTSILSYGSTDTQRIIQVSSLEKDCIGWSFPSQFK